MKPDNQLELEINNRSQAGLAPRRQRQVERAHWWFDQMRGAVDRAVTWPPAQPSGVREAERETVGA